MTEVQRNTVPASQSQPIGSVHRRAQTILDPQGRAARHERRSSTGATLFASAGGTIGRHRRPVTSAGGPLSAGIPGRDGEHGGFGRMDEEEEGDADAARDEQNQREDEQDRMSAEKEFKPVFMKGLFRYVVLRLFFEFLLSSLLLLVFRRQPRSRLL